MKVLIVTDFHGEKKAVKMTRDKSLKEMVDVVVVCGDVTHFGDIKTAESLLKILAEVRLPILFVPGNCDPPELSQDVDVKGVFCLHGRCKEFDELSFIGVGGGTPSPFYTTFELREEEISSTLMHAYKCLSKNKRFMLVSHVPPKDTKLDITHTGSHVGSLAVRKFIINKKPVAVACGHIHESRGVDHINSVEMVNVGPARLGYCAVAIVDQKLKINPTFL